MRRPPIFLDINPVGIISFTSHQSDGQPTPLIDSKLTFPDCKRTDPTPCHPVSFPSSSSPFHLSGTAVVVPVPLERTLDHLSLFFVRKQTALHPTGQHPPPPSHKRRGEDDHLHCLCSPMYQNLVIHRLHIIELS
jgi:hypothetical protein